MYNKLRHSLSMAYVKLKLIRNASAPNL